MKHIYTGDGKGKTTAAVGMTVRAAGAGKRVLFYQFLKDNTSSEIKPLKELDNVTVLKGMDNIGKVWTYTGAEIEKLKPYFSEKLSEISKLTESCDVLVLDEFFVAVKYGYLNYGEAYEFVKAFPHDKELVLTGRGADEKFIDLCDYVSRIDSVKHPYGNGVQARAGIEY